MEVLASGLPLRQQPPDQQKAAEDELAGEDAREPQRAWIHVRRVAWRNRGVEHASDQDAPQRQQRARAPQRARYFLGYEAQPPGCIHGGQKAEREERSEDEIAHHVRGCASARVRGSSNGKPRPRRASERLCARHRSTSATSS